MNAVFDGVRAVVTADDGKETLYLRYEGVYYHSDTPPEVVKALHEARVHRKLIRIYLGDTVTGRDWLEENDVQGYVGNSVGPLKVPLLLATRNSAGGDAILDHCIVKIKQGVQNPQVVYQHPTYHTGKFVLREIDPKKEPTLIQAGLTHAVDVEGENQANFHSFKEAMKYVEKMTG